LSYGYGWRTGEGELSEVTSEIIESDSDGELGRFFIETSTDNLQSIRKQRELVVTISQFRDTRGTGLTGL